MGRRKQARPRRSGVILDKVGCSEGAENPNSDETLDIEEEKVGSYCRIVEIDMSSCSFDEHLDIAEVVVTDSIFREGVSGSSFFENSYQGSNYSFHLRLCNVEEYSDRFKLGHWPVIPANDIFLELLETRQSDDNGTNSVIFSGTFDGSDEGVSGLVHLVNQKIMMLRPIEEIRVLKDISTLRMRVEILKCAFDGCESLLDTSRQPWKKSMVNVMAWLRPEVTTQGAIYGTCDPEIMDLGTQVEIGGSHIVSRSNTGFDAAGFYEAIKPSKGEPMLEDELPDLLPDLRPYQRRAAYWMVQREKRASETSVLMDWNQLFRPFCVPVDFLNCNSRMFYNPFSGNISLCPESSSSYVSGGILADEMGLGKTVELLACIFAHRRLASKINSIFENEEQLNEGRRNNLKRLRRERVECVCGAVSESPNYHGLWVQCDICDAWQHADCVGYSPVKLKSKDTKKLLNRSKGKNSSHIFEVEGNHVCQLCMELIQASQLPIATGATLIVCPSPILHQWHAEITRHTRPGSLKTCVYEGVRNASLSATPAADIGELVNADIVLTTYDVLKEDLSHDSDRHEGDRRFMRFKKRYPVIPTPLTKIFWWRICLDEAQMVESNTAAATEMALRLCAKYRWCITGTPLQRCLDDLYGLLRFLSVGPFEVYRWWHEIIRDPYEKKEAGAMGFTHKLFKQIMWRSSKVHVEDELQLPVQEECVTWLFFSPIEAHFYQRQHETCASYASEIIESFKSEIYEKKVPGSESNDALCDTILTPAEAAKLLHSLLKLRQACCHPQVGSSGLRSMQQSPMTMEEILEVLVGKTKTEGEDALRKLVVALNGMAGIAIIEKDFSRALTLYKEALTVAEEHSDDFRLDPLLNLHIHYNIAEILPVASGYLQTFQSVEGLICENHEEKCSRGDEFDHNVKRQKISSNNSFELLSGSGHSKPQEELCDYGSGILFTGANGGKGSEYVEQTQLSSTSNVINLRKTCEDIKQKYLSVFISKLSLAHQEFINSYTQVCDALGDQEKQQTVWWLEVLDLVEQNKDSSNELIGKVSEVVCGTLNRSKSSRIAAGYRSINGLKYLIQTGLDSLKTSRKALLERLLEIDKTMEEPRDEDVVRVRYCRNCHDNADGPICVLCELDESFQLYEARLFGVTKGGVGGIIASAEEAVDLQKKKSALNQFYWALSRPDKGSSSVVSDKGNKKHRDVGEKVVVSRSPSELEIVIKAIKNYSKSWLRKQGVLAASKHLRLFEAMRKEYAHARSLATAQAQILRAHDEIKMATSRLRLRGTKDDIAIDALGPEELIPANVQFTSEKFVSSALLSHTKGQLRYLKGLVLSKQKAELDDHTSSMHIDKVNSVEVCPICHENLYKQRMVFQCGHVTCCKCLVAMTEQRLLPYGKAREKWVMCPTCRQHTDFRNIAFADDRQNKACDANIPSRFQHNEKPEASIFVQGSYGTKIESVVRRILWIKTTHSQGKVLVFSSWNDVLDVLEHAFSANDVSYVRMKGGRKSHVAITKFRGNACENRNDEKQEKESCQVLLLLIQHGANGLNLLEAQHVILMEPLLNPAAEAQTISRVHRIGQNKMTLVHRFIVKDTVEESIYKLNRSRTTNSILSRNTKNQDHSVLTLKDVESLFSSAIPVQPPNDGNTAVESLRHLPPAVAAAIAAERRWKSLV